MDNFTPNEPQNKQITRVFQIQLATDPTTALHFVPLRLLNDLPEHLQGVDVIELRLVIDRETEGARQI